MVDWRVQILQNTAQWRWIIMNSVVLIIGLTFWFFYRYGGGQNTNNGRTLNQQGNSTFEQVISWVWKISGVFLFIMVIRNLKEVYDFFVEQGDQWFPVIKESVDRMLTSLLQLIKKMLKGG